MNVHRPVRFNERVRRVFSVNERPFFNRSSVFSFSPDFSAIISDLDFWSNLRFCLTFRSFIGIRRFKRLEFRLEILFPFNLLKQDFATVKFDLDPD